MRTTMRMRAVTVAALAALTARCAPGADEAPAAGGGERFERPGVTADRAARQVRVEAACTGLKPGMREREFFVIAPNSGRDYEAYAIARAKPSDVHAALEFIGLKPGRPVDDERMMYWPKGERVRVFVDVPPDRARTADGQPVPPRFRLEEAILDTRTGKPLPADGFVFVGSYWKEGGESGREYAADVEDPSALAAAFNLPNVVLDIPRMGGKSELYPYQVLNPERDLPADTPLTLVLEPDPAPGGGPRALDLVARAAPDGEGLRVRIVDASGATIADAGSTDEAAAYLDGRRREGRDVFLAVEPADDLALPALERLARWVDDLSLNRDVRIEPPPDGHLYHRAFAPNPDFRARETRPAQPCELHLRRAAGGGIEGRLLRIDRVSDPEAGTATFTETAHPASTPEEARDNLLAHGPRLPVLLVFADAATTYGELRAFLRPIRTTHSVVYVFPTAAP
jgi:hypothetical protein